MKVPDIEQIIDKVKNVKNSALSALINLQSHPTIDIDGAKFFMKPHLLIQKIHSDTQIFGLCNFLAIYFITAICFMQILGYLFH